MNFIILQTSSKSELNEKFALFTPIFNSSSLATFIGHPWESTKVEFLKRFEPFCQYKHENISQNLNQVLGLFSFQCDHTEKKIIRHNLDKHLSMSNLKFNDKILIDMFGTYQ